MKKLFTFLMATACAVAATAVAATYLTEATMSLQKAEGTYKVVVRGSMVFTQPR